MLVECLPIGNAGSWIEIAQQLRPVGVIRLPEQFDEPPALAAGGGLFEGHFEEDSVPPTHLVVAVVAEQARVIAERENLFARD